jgi:peptidoglycan/xylan/chitin deacetylase (PgdA/CDA1 family)
MIVLIAFSLLSAHAPIPLGVNPSYAYSPCNCVIFAMDDISDYGLTRVQIATMNYFIAMNLPFTPSIIVGKLANGSNLNVFHKVEEGVNKGLFELAIHGFRHINHSQLSKEEQEHDLSMANAKLEYIFGKRADIFIPPFNEFNLHTIEALSDLHISVFSTHPDTEQRTINPYKSPALVVTSNSRLEVSKVDDEKPLVYHVPFLASFLRLQTEGYFGAESVQQSLKLIDESIAKYGFAHVRLHPTDFSKVNATTGKNINQVDIIKFQRLTTLIKNLEDRNIKIASFSKIYPHS